MEVKSYKAIAYLWSISASKHIHHSIYLEPFYKICFYLFAAIFYMLIVFLLIHICLPAVGGQARGKPRLPT
jgi:hypothetical protein